MRASLWILAAVVAMPAAAADEVKPPVADETTAKCVELEASVAQHKKDKDDNGLVKDLEGIEALHKAPTTEPKHKERLNALIGAVLSGPKSESVEKAALKTVGDIGDEENWKHVRKYVAQPNPKVAPPLLLEGIECAGKLKTAAAVEPLLKIVDDSKVYPPAAAAIKALGNYGTLKGKRARILDVMISSVRKSVPGSGNGMKKGPGENADPDATGQTNATGNSDATRWGALSPSLVEAANKMTGKTAGTAEDWFELYDRYKGKLGDLFEK